MKGYHGLFLAFAIFFVCCLRCDDLNASIFAAVFYCAGFRVQVFNRRNTFCGLADLPENKKEEGFSI